MTAVLVWFGWKTTAEARVAEQLRTRDRLDSAADAMAARIRGKLAETGERLSAWIARPSSPLPQIDGAVVFAATADRIDVVPAGALPFIPFASPPRPPHPLLAEVEILEFRANDPAEAAARYERLAHSPDAPVRAGALLRHARLLLRSGKAREAANVYAKLGALGSIDVDGYPAALVALDGRRAAARAAGDREDEIGASADIVRAIDDGRWRLSRGTAESFRDVPGAPPRPEAWAIAAGLAAVAPELTRRAPERGLRVADVDGRRVVLLWRANATGVAAAAGFAERLLPEMMTPAVAQQVTDAEGRVALGAASAPSHATVRVVDTPAPWTLKVWAVDSPGGSPALARYTVPGLITVVLFFLWTAVYFIARAIRREAAVARLQSDFVAAVSHEFRSPLTTVRQLAEMLEMDRVPTEARRRQYYEVLANEARRLQRLVETLLNFGKMEANAQQYRFEPVDVAQLVSQLARDIDEAVRPGGRRVEASGPVKVPPVMGDGDALAVAVRNLIDNALKYSPGTETVWVEWEARNGHVSIRVIDRGLGIAPSERRAIFQRFVRGRAATAANAKGTGVGLAMVQHIAAAHHGAVLVDSEPGRGSTFTLQLPVVN